MGKGILDFISSINGIPREQGQYTLFADNLLFFQGMDVQRAALGKWLQDRKFVLHEKIRMSVPKTETKYV